MGHRLGSQVWCAAYWDAEDHIVDPSDLTHGKYLLHLAWTWEAQRV